MVESQTHPSAEEELYHLQAEFCKGIAHPKRIQILNVLKRGEKTVNELARLTGIPQANVSQHLGILRQLNIVEARRNGSSVYYSIADRRVIDACELVRKSIGDRLRKSRAVLKVAA